MEDFEMLDPESPEEMAEYYKNLWEQDFLLLSWARSLLKEVSEVAPAEWLSEGYGENIASWFEMFNATHPIVHPEDPDLFFGIDGEWVTIEEHLQSVKKKFS